MMLTYQKSCTSCGALKSLQDFPRRNGGRMPICTDCDRLRQASIRKRNRAPVAPVPDPMADMFNLWLASCDGRKLVGFPA